MDILFNLVSGNQSIDNELELAGFERVEVEGSFTLTADNSTQFGPDIYDYAGIKFNSSSYLRDQVESAYDSISFDRPAVLITSNLVSDADTDYSSATQQMESLSHKLIIWMHFDHNSTTGGDTLYCKLKVNYSSAEIENILNSEFQNAMAGYWERGESEPAITVKGNGGSHNFEKTLNDPCTEVSCSLFDWNAWCCILKNDDYLNHPYFKNVFLEGPIGFQIGVVCGVLDGLLGTINFLYEIAQTATSLTPPGSLHWIISSLYHWWKQGAYNAKFEKDKEFAGKALQVIKYVFNNPEQLVKGIWDGIVTFFDQLDPRTGLASSGYAIGKVLFEVILDYITGGTNLLADLLPKVKQTLKGLTNRNAWKVAVEDFVENSTATVEKLICKVKYGCFIKNTLVHTRAGLVPIENFAKFRGLVPSF